MTECGQMLFYQQWHIGDSKAAIKVNIGYGFDRMVQHRVASPYIRGIGQDRHVHNTKATMSTRWHTDPKKMSGGNEPVICGHCAYRERCRQEKENLIFVYVLCMCKESSFSGDTWRWAQMNSKKVRIARVYVGGIRSTNRIALCRVFLQEKEKALWGSMESTTCGNRLFRDGYTG